MVDAKLTTITGLCDLPDAKFSTSHMIRLVLNLAQTPVICLVQNLAHLIQYAYR